jgi:hypothetical protein
MTLSDLRKLSIKKNLRIRFVLANGMECVVTQHGIAQLPALKTVPGFNIEEELVSVREFLLEPAVIQDKKTAAKSRSVSREELESMTNAPAAAAVAGHDEHEDE